MNAEHRKSTIAVVLIDVINNCVPFTAHDAYLRGFKVVVASDAVASQSEESTWRPRPDEDLAQGAHRPGGLGVQDQGLSTTAP